MEYMYELKEKLCRELKEVAQKLEMGAGDLELIHKLTDTIKNIDKISALEEGYSQSYDRGNSYKHYVRGHYSRYSRDYSGGRYSRDGKNRMMERLEEMMQEAGSDKEREAIRRCMSQMED